MEKKKEEKIAMVVLPFLLYNSFIIKFSVYLSGTRIFKVEWKEVEFLRGLGTFSGTSCTLLRHKSRRQLWWEPLSHNEDKWSISDLVLPFLLKDYDIDPFFSDINRNFPNLQNNRNLVVVESKWLTRYDFTSFCEYEYAFLKKGLLLQSNEVFRQTWSITFLLPTFHIFFLNSLWSGRKKWLPSISR